MSSGVGKRFAGATRQSFVAPAASGAKRPARCLCICFIDKFFFAIIYWCSRMRVVLLGISIDSLRRPGAMPPDPQNENTSKKNFCSFQSYDWEFGGLPQIGGRSAPEAAGTNTGRRPVCSFVQRVAFQNNIDARKSLFEILTSGMNPDSPQRERGRSHCLGWDRSASSRGWGRRCRGTRPWSPGRSRGSLETRRSSKRWRAR